MKSKKWIIITIISVVLLAASIVFLFVYLLPTMKTGKALDELAEGDDDAIELFGEMDSDKRDSLKDDVKDIIVYTANQYVDGKKNYKETFDVLSTVEKIRAYRGMTEEAFEIITLPKLKDIYETAVLAYDGGNAVGQDFYDAQNDFNAALRLKEDKDDVDSIYYDWDSNTSDKFNKAMTDAMDAYLKEKEDAYAAGDMEYQKIMDYCTTASYFWYSDYASSLRNTLYYEEVLSKNYDEIKAEYDEKEYFDVIDDVNYEKNWYEDQEAWKKWGPKFEELAQQATDQGKVYYVQEAIRYVNEGDMYEAEWLMSKMKQYFGDDFDLSEVEAAIEENSHEAWMEAYVEMMKGWRQEVESDLKYASMTAGLIDPSQYTVDDINPDRVILQDLDGDKTPELLLKGEKQILVYGYDGYDADFAGLLTPIGFGNTPYVVVEASEKIDEETDVAVEALLSYKDCRFTAEKIVGHAEYMGQTVYLHATGDGNAEQLDEETYKTELAEVESYISGNLPEGVAITDYEEYIYHYGK